MPMKREPQRQTERGGDRDQREGMREQSMACKDGERRSRCAIRSPGTVHTRLIHTCTQYHTCDGGPIRSFPECS